MCSIKHRRTPSKTVLSINIPDTLTLISCEINSTACYTDTASCIKISMEARLICLVKCDLSTAKQAFNWHITNGAGTSLAPKQVPPPTFALRATSDQEAVMWSMSRYLGLSPFEKQHGWTTWCVKHSCKVENHID